MSAGDSARQWTCAVIVAFCCSVSACLPHTTQLKCLELPGRPVSLHHQRVSPAVLGYPELVVQVHSVKPAAAQATEPRAALQGAAAGRAQPLTSPCRRVGGRRS